MKVHQFLDHYGVTENPFAQEDAASDSVFQEHCLDATHHSSWDKIYGNPNTPSTSVVFGQQGSGKTALRLQIVKKLQEHNLQNPNKRAFIVEYDDFNPFLDCFRERLSSRQRKPERALQNWRLWDHMDSILTLAVTRLANEIRNNGTDAKDSTHSIPPEKISELTRPQKRDIMLLSSFYDHNRELAPNTRWSLLKRKLKFSTWKSWWAILLGVVGTAATVGLTVYLDQWKSLFNWWIIAIVFAFWVPFLWNQLKSFWTARNVSKQIRIVDHSVNALRKCLTRFTPSELSGQAIPNRARGDDRYEMIMKFQSILETLGFTSIVVLIDRVDEPHLINGSPERMRDLIWPLFDNKFLKHPGIAFKLLLPAAVAGFLNRQEKEFYERSRLDKQNLISSLNWTGQGLYDVANDRIRACTKLTDKTPSIKDFFADSVTENDLISTFDKMRAPRHLFKFLHRLLVDHCSKYTEDQPQWKIQPETTHTTLAIFLRDLEAYDQKLGTG